MQVRVTCESLMSHTWTAHLHVMIYLARWRNSTISDTCTHKHMSNTHTYSDVSDVTKNSWVLLQINHEALTSCLWVAQESLMSPSQMFVKLAESGTVYMTMQFFPCLTTISIWNCIVRAACSCTWIVPVQGSISVMTRSAAQWMRMLR